jgi:hypothetical protein
MGAWESLVIEITKYNVNLRLDCLMRISIGNRTMVTQMLPEKRNRDHSFSIGFSVNSCLEQPS